MVYSLLTGTILVACMRLEDERSTMICFPSIFRNIFKLSVSGFFVFVSQHATAAEKCVDEVIDDIRALHANIAVENFLSSRKKNSLFLKKDYKAATIELLRSGKVSFESLEEAESVQVLKTIDGHSLAVIVHDKGINTQTGVPVFYKTFDAVGEVVTPGQDQLPLNYPFDLRDAPYPLFARDVVLENGKVIRFQLDEAVREQKILFLRGNGVLPDSLAHLEQNNDTLVKLALSEFRTGFIGFLKSEKISSAQFEKLKLFTAKNGTKKAPVLVVENSAKTLNERFFLLSGNQFVGNVEMPGWAPYANLTTKPDFRSLKLSDGRTLKLEVGVNFETLQPTFEVKIKNP